VFARPPRTTDAALLQDLFYRLRPEDVLTRFFRRLSSLTRQMAEHLCSVGYEDEMAFAAVVGDSETERVVGTSSYFRDPETGLADVAYMVDPEWQGRGLGRALHERTADYARRQGVVGFTADVLSGNDAMLAIFRASEGDLEAVEEQGIFEVVLRFDPADSLRP
jgi:RimJ/RimL family protein N-acetyltransferase